MKKTQRKSFRLIAVLTALVITLTALTGCSSGSNQSTAKAANGSGTDQGSAATKIRIAYAATGKPINYTDENGNATGYDVEIFKLIDERLPEYEFEFIGTTDEELLTGVETGKYDVGLKNCFWTAARAEKYIYPKNNLGASASGLLIRKEDEGVVKDLSDIATLGRKLLPISPSDAQYALVQNYNKENPDNQITIEESESFTVQDGILWIAEGRYDAWLVIKSSYDANVVAEDGPYHNLANELSWSTFAATKTWPLFNKNFQALADAYDKIIVDLKNEGKVSELLIKFLGEDTTVYLTD